jgi:hypothetical protein
MPVYYYIIAAYAISISVGAIYFRSLPQPYRLVFFLTVLAAITEVCGHYISHTLGKPNLWLFNFYIIVETWVLGLVAISFIRDKLLRQIFFALLVIFSGVWLFFVIKNSIYAFANIPLVLGAIMMVVMYVTALVTNMLFTDKQIYKQPLFWLCLSVMLYFGCVVPVVALFNYLVEKMPVLGRKLGMIIIVLTIVRYPLVAVSYLLLGREKAGALKPV